jgi:hypothetical protein
MIGMRCAPLLVEHRRLERLGVHTPEAKHVPHLDAPRGAQRAVVAARAAVAGVRQRDVAATVVEVQSRP